MVPCGARTRACCVHTRVNVKQGIAKNGDTARKSACATSFLHYSSDFTKLTSSGSVHEIAWPSRSGSPAYLRTTLPFRSMM